MITSEEAVYVLYRVVCTREYQPSAVYSHCEQFVLDPLLAEITHEFVLDPLLAEITHEFVLDPVYQQPKRQFQPEAPLRKITT